MIEIAATGLLSFIFGLIIGIFSARTRFKYDRRLDKIRRLTPFMERIQPLYEHLNIDSEHCIKLRETIDNDEFNHYLSRINDYITNFGNLYTNLRGEGLADLLHNFDEELYNNLVGTFVFYQYKKDQEFLYLAQNLNDIHDNAVRTKNAINQFFKT